MENPTADYLNSTVDVSVNVSLKHASTILVGPNILSGQWTPEMVWNTGFVDEYKDNLAALSVEKYAFSFPLHGNSYAHHRDNQISVKQLLCFDRKGSQHLLPGDLRKFPQPFVWG
jgi:hypothetical protein